MRDGEMTGGCVKCVCAGESIDHKVDIRDCACFRSGIIRQATGCLERTSSS